MLNHFLLCLIGLSSGIIVSGGIVGFMISLFVIPRYAFLSHTTHAVSIYEFCIVFGTVFGNIFYLFSLDFIMNKFFLLFWGLSAGIFLGSWIIALTEIAKVFTIFLRRLHLKSGIPSIIIAMALGKTLGSLIYYYKSWF